MIIMEIRKAKDKIKFIFILSREENSRENEAKKRAWV